MSTEYNDLDIQLRCKSCGELWLSSKLKNYHCPVCLGNFSHNCHECDNPIPDNEYYKYQGYCKMCHASWLRADAYKSSIGVEIYPNTGV